MNAKSGQPLLKIVAADRDEPVPYYDQKAAEIGATVVYGGATNEQRLIEVTEDADAVIVFRTHVSPAAIARMKKCQVLIRQGIGFDLIDVPAATQAGIFVSNVPDYCVDEVANHAMMLLLASVRNLMDYHRVIHEKGWGYYNASRKVPAIDELTLGLIGLGKIGRATARKAAAFGMKMIGYDPYVHQDVFDWMGVERIRRLDDLLGTADVVSLHTPLTAETEGMFGAPQFARMKPGSYFINTARGAVVELAALDEALASGHLTAAAIDVFQEEPMRTDHPILRHKNLIVTPHVAFYSERSLKAVVAGAFDEVVRVLRGDRPLNLVNPEVFRKRPQDRARR